MLTDRELEGRQYDIPEPEYHEDDEKLLKKQAVIRRILNECYQEKQKQEPILQEIQRDYSLAGNVQQGVDYAEAIHSQFTFTATKKVKQKIQFPSYELDITAFEGEEGMSKEEKAINRAILLDGSKKLINISGIRQTFNGDGGIKGRAVLFGDCFFMVKWDAKKKCAVFEIIPFDNLFWESKVNAIRNAPTGMTAGKMIVSYDYDDYDSFVNSMKGIVKEQDMEGIKWGNVPLTNREDKSLDETIEQFNERKKKPGQVMILFDLDNEKEEWYAGVNLHPILTKKTWEYVIDNNGEYGEKVIPIFHLSMFDRTAGLLSDGMGHLSSERNKLDSALRQANAAALVRDSSGLMGMDVLKGTKIEALKGIDDTMRNFRDGIGSGVYIREVEQGTPPLKIEPIFRERTNTEGVSFISRQNTNDLIALGVNIQDVNSDPNKTAFAVKEDNIASSELASEIVIQWGEEIRLALELVFALNKKMIRKNDKRKFVAKHTVISEQEAKARDEMQAEGLPRSAISSGESVTKKTLGEWAKLAQSVDFEISLIASSGIMPDTTVERSKNQEMLNTVGSLFPGTPIVNKVGKLVFSSYGIETTEDDFMPKQVAQPPQGMAPQGGMGGMGMGGMGMGGKVPQPQF